MLNHGAKLNFASKTKRNQKRKYYLCNVYPIPEAPMGGGWADIYTYKGVTVRFGFDSVRIWQFEQKLSKTKQRERLMRCIIYSPHWLRTIMSFVVKRVFYIHTQAWGFRRCSFRQLGRCQSLYTVERVTGLAPRFSCIYTNPFINHTNMAAVGKKTLFMDSILLLSETAGKVGQKCKVSVTTGDAYSGYYRGYCESTREHPLTLRLEISEEEAKRIGTPWLREIGVPYDVITNVSF